MKCIDVVPKHHVCVQRINNGKQHIGSQSIPCDDGVTFHSIADFDDAVEITHPLWRHAQHIICRGRSFLALRYRHSGLPFAGMHSTKTYFI